MAERHRSLWTDAIRRLLRDRLAIASLAIIVLYAAIAVGVQLGVVAADYNVGSDDPAVWQQPPSLEHPFGTDVEGRSILSRTLYGAKIALSVGLVVGLISVSVGLFLGALAGYRPGIVDELVVWVYTTVDAIPYILLLVALSFILRQWEIEPIVRVWIAMSVTFWTGTARVIRGEVIKQRTRDYVVAAQALGASGPRILFGHIVPNVLHLAVINFSLLFVGAIKNEVILSYLGLGVVGEPSWGILIDNAKMELGGGYWWQLTAATAAMFFLVLAFNVFSDALRDALDPKLHR
jgi:ABC-type dipeptide/oligopeptide/nickel transport system permease subunit